MEDRINLERNREGFFRSQILPLPYLSKPWTVPTRCLDRQSTSFHWLHWPSICQVIITTPKKYNSIHQHLFYKTMSRHVCGRLLYRQVRGEGEFNIFTIMIKVHQDIWDQGKLGAACSCAASPSFAHCLAHSSAHFAHCFAHCLANGSYQYIAICTLHYGKCSKK